MRNSDWLWFCDTPRVLHSVLGAGRGCEYEIKYELMCMSREALQFLALEPVSFSTTAAYSFVFAVWGCDQIGFSIRKLSAGALYRHKHGLGSP